MVGEDRSTLAAGDHPHDQSPIFKIGDLGDVNALRTPGYRRSLKAHAMFRVSGNPTCNTPEQFAPGWNNVYDDASLAQEDTAGKFDCSPNNRHKSRLIACGQT
ncbi:hypothetical protein INS49_010504 [Diaporthe citri]|uniref:uncharacterized protein n=1 Tax=Diaporthe citri TaxID=83186 RepID=UPI001C80510D|nr:uncharacterized protein INS49_010504 [Diaporthe citri]KAG6362274.1 hypothetical protein INS49_010504 [Diaporthe citri]